MISTVVLASSLLAAGVFQVRFFLRRCDSSSRSWNEIIEEIASVRADALFKFADLYALGDECAHPERQAQRVWVSIGGIRGMKRLLRNIDVMLELAVYAERWNETHGSVLSELIRRDALQLRKLFRKLVFLYYVRRNSAEFSRLLCRWATSYQASRTGLLGLYQITNSALLPELELAFQA